MEVNRKLNAFGAIIGAIGIFGVIIGVLVLMNSLQFRKGLADQGQVAIPPSRGFQITKEDGNIEYHIIYLSNEGNITVDQPVSEEEFESFSVDTTEPVMRHVFVDSYGNYYSYEDLNATKETVLKEVNMPFTVPILVIAGSVIVIIAGFVWAFKGKPSKGKDLGEIIQAKREAEEAEEAAMNAEKEVVENVKDEGIGDKTDSENVTDLENEADSKDEAE